MRQLPCLFLLLCLGCTSASDPGPITNNWSHYGGDPGRTHFSPLTQITAANVADLQPLWTYASGGADTAANSQIQCNPIVVDGLLYGTTPQLHLFAVDAVTGEEAWRFDPRDAALDAKGSVYKHVMTNNRGVTHWTDGAGDHRIFYAAGSRLYAVDARTGRLKSDFGYEGYIDLHDGLGREVTEQFIVATSPPAVYRDLLIVGTRVDETLPAAPGHLRAYDVRTGEQRWTFHTIPQPGQYGHDSWDDPEAYRYTGGANAWSGLSVDHERGLVFCGTGSAAYDFYGGNRGGDNLFANCILALDAATGERRWHYQTIHHDIWDRDNPTPPMLVTIDREDGPVDAVVQATKMGFVFVLDRETGEPLFEVVETPVPTEGGLPGEYISPTQPIPTLPKPFARTTLGPDDINPDLTQAERTAAEEVFATHRYGNQFNPPGPRPMLMLPDFDGGAGWGGPAYDPASSTLFVNANNVPAIIAMEEVPAPAPVAEETVAAAGSRLYDRYCRSCHGADRAGTEVYPTLTGLTDRYDHAGFAELLHTGRRMMPAFAYLTDEEVAALSLSVLEPEAARGREGFVSTQAKREDAPPHIPYKLAGYRRFITPSDKPAIAPPWGTLTAIDLSTGNHRWQVPLGNDDTRENIGVRNYGGGVVTAGGLFFIAATRDGMIRAFDTRNGTLTWSHKLPTAGYATPAVYEAGGRQILVIACGGGRMGQRSGDRYVAFALP